MKLTDSREIAASRDDVWAAILNPEVLKTCIPGCQEMTGSAADGFEAVVVQKVGPVKATFKGAVEISYDVEAKVGGKLAQLGSRIIDGFTKKLADQFFERFQDGLEGPTDDDTDQDDETPKKGWIGRMLG